MPAKLKKAETEADALRTLLYRRWDQLVKSADAYNAKGAAQYRRVLAAAEKYNEAVAMAYVAWDPPRLDQIRLPAHWEIDIEGSGPGVLDE